ncbi:MAG: hypothetical protein KDD47_23320, partial [Acidobacteria bacterium]|nr:hypothetical protein [Acidobacteriota bacterium]
LNIVEAILLGLPAVATGYGGNVDFCDPASVDLIDFDLVPGEDPQGLYQGSFHWAEPRLEHFCALLKELDGRGTDELDERRRQARERVFEHFSTERIRDLVTTRLVVLRQVEAE